MTRFLFLSLALACALAGQTKPVAKPAAVKPSVAKPTAAKPAAPSVDPATIDVVFETDLGMFRVELFPKVAPKHADAFVKNAQSGFYNGSAFHRMIANGIIQGGDPLLKVAKTPRKAWGSGGLNLLPDEFSDLKHTRGILSAVRLPDKPNSGGAQFFVCVQDQPVLDGKYSAFGRVIEGIEVIDEISRAPVEADGLAGKPARIKSARVEAKPEEPFTSASLDELRKTVVMKTTLGTIKIKMEPDWAPETVRSFLKLSSAKWYVGTGFHRVIKDFMIQGGLPESKQGNLINQGKISHPADRWVRMIKGEFRSDAKHVRGVISMARNQNPDSALTSFFLMLGDATNLDGQYAAFGRITDGLDVLKNFEQQELQGEKPVQRLEILDISIE